MIVDWLKHAERDDDAVPQVNEEVNGDFLMYSCWVQIRLVWGSISLLALLLHLYRSEGSERHLCSMSDQSEKILVEKLNKLGLRLLVHKILNQTTIYKQRYLQVCTSMYHACWIARVAGGVWSLTMFVICDERKDSRPAKVSICICCSSMSEHLNNCFWWIECEHMWCTMAYVCIFFHETCWFLVPEVSRIIPGIT